MYKTDPLFFPEEQAFFAYTPWFSSYDWAKENFRIVSGPLKGKLWDPDYIPYAKGIMEWFDKPFVRKMYICAPSQSAKTTIAYACLAAAMSRGSNRGPAGVAMGDEQAVRRIFSDKLGKHFLQSPTLRKQLARRADAVQNTEIKMQDGANLIGIWSGSEAKMSSVTLQFLIIDEEDLYEDKDAVAKLEERVIAYEFESKIIRISKPRGVEEESTIYPDMQAECQAVFEREIRCPVCRTRQVMDLDQIRVPDNERDPKRILGRRLAWYECTACGYRMNDHVRNKANAAGIWKMKKEVDRPTVVGFHLPSWYSPAVSLSKVMADFFRTRDGGPRLWTWFKNSHEALPGKTVVVEATEDQLQQFVVPMLPPQIVPEEALKITLSVDTQKDHFVYSICAHGLEPAQEWIIDYGKAGTFQELRELRLGRFRRDNSEDLLPIWRAAVDTGGTKDEYEEESRTVQVYRWLLSLKPRFFFGTKGMSGHKDPDEMVKFKLLQKFPNGRAMKTGLRLYHINTDQFKDEIFWRFSEEATDFIWFHAQTDRRYFRQILSEKKVTEKKRVVWKRVRKDNHYLDTLVGHLAMVHWQWAPSLQSLAGRQKAEDRKQGTGNRSQEAKNRRQEPGPGRSKPSWFNNR